MLQGGREEGDYIKVLRQRAFRNPEIDARNVSFAFLLHNVVFNFINVIYVNFPPLSTTR